MKYVYQEEISNKVLQYSHFEIVACLQTLSNVLHCQVCFSMAQSTWILVFGSLSNTISVGPTCTAVVPLVVKSPESCDCVAVLEADSLDLAFGTGRILCMAALEYKAFSFFSFNSSCLDFSC